MSFLLHLAALGIWPALPLTGEMALGLGRGRGLPHGSAVDRFALAAAVGLALWSIPLLLSVVLDVYSGAVLGLAGWVTVGAALARAMRRPRARPAVRRPAGWDAVLLAGLAGAGVLYLAFPTETMMTGRDMGVYTAHAIHIAERGTLTVPYPWPPELAPLFRPAFRAFPGFYATPGAMTPQFGHLFPAWLAQAYAAFGIGGLYRANGVLALLSAGVLYGACRAVAGKAPATVAILFLAYNVSQLWLARITLTEILTQLLVWAGLLLLLRALDDGDVRLAGWAGLLLGVSVLVRIDALLVLPLLFLAHLAHRILADSAARRSAVWLSVYRTAVPAYALGVAYYRVFSRPYYDQHEVFITPMIWLTAAAVGALLLGMTPLGGLVRPLARSRAALAAVVLVVVGLSAYAYVLRPLQEPKPVFSLRGTPVPGMRSHVEEALVNLGAYLSPPVVVAGIAGWLLVCGAAMRRGRGLHLLPVLAVCGALTAAYVRDQAIYPDHYWAIRRFVPVVIPGLVLFAAVAADWAVRRARSRPLSRGLAIAALLFLTGWTAHAAMLSATFAESRGTDEAVRALAARLPTGAPVVAIGSLRWAAALHVVFDRPVVPLDLDTAAGRDALGAWVRRRSARGEVAYLLELRRLPDAGGAGIAGFGRVPVFAIEITRIHSERTVHPLPRRTATERWRVTLYRLTSAPPDASGPARRARIGGASPPAPASTPAGSARP